MGRTKGKSPAPQKKDPKAGTVGKLAGAQKAKKEVEGNPFRSLIDISDLVEYEQKPEQVQKEVQNILLRHNSELKQWYKLYARKVESTKSEESFAMTLRQTWRFLRDCGLVSQSATLAQIDRTFNQGKKNHFTILGEKDKHRFAFVSTKGAGEWRPTTDQRSRANASRAGGGTANASAMGGRQSEEGKAVSPAEVSALSGGVAQSKELPPPTGKIDDASFIENSKIETDKGGKSTGGAGGQPAERKMLEDSESEEETPLELLTMEAEDIHAPTKYKSKF